jgi:peptidoglycan/LPS O-acetylase OafA/YrhL
VHNRLASLTSLRFFAAFLVFLNHAAFIVAYSAAAAAFRHGYVDVVNKAGMIGVSFFFILSGFVLTWSARPHDTSRLFWRRRLFKIYPIHLVTFVLAFLVFAGVPHSGSTRTWSTSILNVFLVQTWLPGPDLMDVANIPSWSLSSEVFFYLCFPLLYWGIKKIPANRLWHWAAGVSAVIIAVPVVVTLLPGGPTMPIPGGPNGFPVPQWNVWFINAFPPVRMLEFVLGILMARIVLTGGWVNLRAVPMLVLTAASYTASLFVPWRFSLVATTLIPLALLIPAVAASDLTGATSLLRNRLLVWLGEVSFALYMVHFLVIGLLRRVIGVQVFAHLGTLGTIGTVTLTLGLSLLAAWVLHIAVENPIMRRWSRPATHRPTNLHPTTPVVDPGPDNTVQRVA